MQSRRFSGTGQLGFSVPMDRPSRFHSRTSATTCLRLSPVAHRPLEPSSCRVSAICARFFHEYGRRKPGGANHCRKMLR